MTLLSGFTGEYEGWNRLKLIQKVLRGLGSNVATAGTDTTSDYTRYPKQDIIDRLDEGQIDFVRKTECLSTFAIIEAVANQATYRMPRNYLTALDIKYYTGTSTYEQMRLLSHFKQLKRISNTWQTDSGTIPEYAYPWHSYGNVRTLGVYPKPSSAGTDYSGSTPTGIALSATDFTFSGNVTGTHRVGAGDNRAYVEDESGRDFTTLGVVVGMMVFNSTDGSSGQITAISNGNATNDRLAVTLTGGTDNDFDESDSFEVTLGSYGVVIDASGDESWIFSTTLGALQDISPLSGNFLMDYVRRPLLLGIDTQVPDIPYDYQMAPVAYAVWKLGGTEYDGAVQEARAAEAKEEYVGLVDHYNGAGREEIDTDQDIEDRAWLHYGTFHHGR